MEERKEQIKELVKELIDTIGWLECYAEDLEEAEELDDLLTVSTGLDSRSYYLNRTREKLSSIIAEIEE